MSHAEQLAFFEIVANANRSTFADGRVLEIGSYDVNGSVRALFRGAREYVGVDLVKGPGVDRVGYGHEIQDAANSYNMTISGECFEHDPQWTHTFGNMVRLTRPGGIVAFTCASRGRPEHGTTRSDPTLSPGTQARGVDYYRNLEEQDFARLPLAEWFSEWRFWYLPTSMDLYFVGVRAGEGEDGEACLPRDGDVEALIGLMTWRHRAARRPLLVVSRVLSGQRYQTVIRPYWKMVLKYANRDRPGDRSR